jgi:pimeloyl-ACP methyl ester carboxylesterase
LTPVDEILISKPMAIQSRTIVFIHGMYMTPLCWENWIPWFEKRGYRAHSPAWPGRDEKPETLRSRHPDPRLAELTLDSIVDHLAGFISGLPEKPVLIGHSMGGLVAQLLLQKGIAAAAVAVDSAPPAGLISARWSFLKSNWPHITPFASLDLPVVMTFERFSYAFANTLPAEKQRAAFERYVVPESRRVPRQSLTSTARVDFQRPHEPLLFIAGSSDHIIPASLNRKNARRYAHPASLTAFREFPGRDHFIIGEEGWEEVAGFIASWLENPKAGASGI